MKSNIIFDRQEYVAVITLNKPQSLNALNLSLLLELEEAIALFANDLQLRVAIITGVEKSFVAGADIQSMSTMDYTKAKEFGQVGARVFRSIEMCPKPIIAAVNGFALGGGCELALACDLRVASEKAKFGQPEVGLGITPGFSGTQRLARTIGLGKARELIFTGKIIGATEALRLGLVNDVVVPEELISTALNLAHTISKQAPVAIQNAKKAIMDGWDLPIDEGIALEVDLFARCFETQDQKRGMNAFLNKEKIDYEGK
ncbi:MAG: enoyl-CoA hydratase-related protein [Porphyromonas sp.]|nr:enoyl-CoA hydratase-related protein [Porphyromonas sp.]